MECVRAAPNVLRNNNNNNNSRTTRRRNEWKKVEKRMNYVLSFCCSLYLMVCASAFSHPNPMVALPFYLCYIAFAWNTLIEFGALCASVKNYLHSYYKNYYYCDACDAHHAFRTKQNHQYFRFSPSSTSQAVTTSWLLLGLLLAKQIEQCFCSDKSLPTLR